LVMEGTP